jgi:hypothetical protein
LVIKGIGLLIVGVALTAAGVSLAVERGPFAWIWMDLASINWNRTSRRLRGALVYPFKRPESHRAFTKWFSAFVLTVIGVAWILGGIVFIYQAG